MATHPATPRPRATNSAAAALLIGAGAVVLGVLGAAAPANATASKFVAIAYSPDARVFGYANGYATQTDAQQFALASCQEHGGTDCRITGWAQDGCAALAVDTNRYYGWYGPTPAAAEQQALYRNGGGHIIEVACT